MSGIWLWESELGASNTEGLLHVLAGLCGLTDPLGYGIGQWGRGDLLNLTNGNSAREIHL